MFGVSCWLVSQLLDVCREMGFVEIGSEVEG